MLASVPAPDVSFAVTFFLLLRFAEKLIKPRKYGSSLRPRCLVSTSIHISFAHVSPGFCVHMRLGIRAACVDIDQHLNVPSPLTEDTVIDLDDVTEVVCEEVDDDGDVLEEIIVDGAYTLTLRSSNNVRFEHSTYFVVLYLRTLSPIVRPTAGPDLYPAPMSLHGSGRWGKASTCLHDQIWRNPPRGHRKNPRVGSGFLDSDFVRHQQKLLTDHEQTMLHRCILSCGRSLET